jgi:hypothetical protein
MSEKNDNWNYKDFYDIAPSYDLFTIDGRDGVWIPTERCLLAWTGR